MLSKIINTRELHIKWYVCFDIIVTHYSHELIVARTDIKDRWLLKKGEKKKNPLGLFNKIEGIRKNRTPWNK